MKTQKEIEELFEQAKNGTLPKNFQDWGLASEEGAGWTVAHIAAAFDNLPKNFQDWNLKNKLNTTVEHIARLYNNLPKDFNC